MVSVFRVTSDVMSCYNEDYIDRFEVIIILLIWELLNNYPALRRSNNKFNNSAKKVIIGIRGIFAEANSWWIFTTLGLVYYMGEYLNVKNSFAVFSRTWENKNMVHEPCLCMHGLVVSQDMLTGNWPTSLFYILFWPVHRPWRQWINRTVEILVKKISNDLICAWWSRPNITGSSF